MENELNKPRITWNEGAAILISIGIFLLYGGLQFVVLAAYVAIQISTGALDLDISQGDEVEQYATGLMENGDAIAWIGTVSGILGILMVLAFAKFKKGNDYRLQLGLYKPAVKQILFWVFIMLALSVVLELLASQFDLFKTDFMDGLLADCNQKVLLLVAVGFIGPIFEELLFRGFFLDGLLRTGMGNLPAVLISSVAFAVVHLQYDASIMAAIVILGMILAYSRIYSKSLYVPILLHVINNTAAFFWTMSQLGS